ncbi:5' nucleotidase, NT5C type [Clostridium perfringens]|uniref:5' nucleotidase, NT5C type n=1 Tax=Clostridium perfringens TaxID=1502 RepID=UPI00096A2C9B|nr:hypothetical protein [Clostridium perfringens]
MRSKNENLQLFIDLDGVVCNIDKAVATYIHKTTGIKHDWRLNFHWWWSSWIDRNEAEELLLQENFFYNLEPIEEAIETIDKLHEEGYEIYFLTTPQFNQYCTYEKTEWLHEHFSWFDENKHLVLTGNKKLLDGDNRLLLDDSPNNLKWDKGINICFDHLYNRDYKGLRANNWCDFYSFIKLMERGSN